MYPVSARVLLLTRYSHCITLFPQRSLALHARASRFQSGLSARFHNLRLQHDWKLVCNRCDNSIASPLPFVQSAPAAGSNVLFASWCNGSTADSGSVCHGSNPCEAARSGRERSVEHILEHNERFPFITSLAKPPRPCLSARMKEPTPDASPMKSVVEELESLRSDFKSALESYSTRIETEISAIRSAVEKEGSAETPSSAKMRDLRDMLTLLRKFQIKPEKGRRKDLKKLDALVGDLTLLIETW